ncbi:MAG: hypothetical protein HOQ25_14180 [Mesorhizobium sp.]|nr:hypothetical protein [Mesorhizobium sp.]
MLFNRRVARGEVLVDLVYFRITFVAMGLLGLAAAMRFLVLPANAGGEVSGHLEDKWHRA